MSTGWKYVCFLALLCDVLIGSRIRCNMVMKFMPIFFLLVVAFSLVCYEWCIIRNVNRFAILVWLAILLWFWCLLLWTDVAMKMNFNARWCILLMAIALQVYYWWTVTAECTVITWRLMLLWWLVGNCNVKCYDLMNGSIYCLFVINLSM